MKDIKGFVTEMKNLAGISEVPEVQEQSSTMESGGGKYVVEVGEFEDKNDARKMAILASKRLKDRKVSVKFYREGIKFRHFWDFETGRLVKGGTEEVEPSDEE